MAFSKTPRESTYQTKTIKLISQWETRDPSGTKDNDTVNCYYEVIKNKTSGDKDYYVTSRDGTSVYATIDNVPRGMYYWEEQDKLFVARGNNISVFTGSTGAAVADLAVFGTATGEVGFTEFGYSTGQIKLVVTDGTTLVTIDAGLAVVPSVSPDLPVPHIPTPLFLDGYLFLAKTSTADIYNSDLDDPLLYTAGNFISAEMLPDSLKAIARLNNYIVAFGTASIEYFFDAANASGSPLQRYEAPIKFVGFLNGLTAWGNKLMFMGQTAQGQPELFVLDDLKMESLGSPPLRRYIAPYGAAVAYGTTISFAGHDFYVLNQGVLTYMYDMETKLWTRLRYKTETGFRITYAALVSVTGVGYCSIVTVTDSTSLLLFNPALYLDSGVDFSPTLVTDPDDFDSYKTKFGGRLSILADRPTNSSYVTVYWSDDDYQTWSSGRQIALNKVYPHLDALGKFRRRAHKLIHTGNARFRVQTLELDINIGAR